MAISSILAGGCALDGNPSSDLSSMSKQQDDLWDKRCGREFTTCPDCGARALQEPPLTIYRDGVKRTVIRAICQGDCRDEYQVTTRTGRPITKTKRKIFETSKEENMKAIDAKKQEELRAKVAAKIKRDGITQGHAADEIGTAYAGFNRWLRGKHNFSQFTADKVGVWLETEPVSEPDPRPDIDVPVEPRFITLNEGEAEAFRSARLEHGLSQKGLGDMLGVPQCHVSCYERMEPVKAIWALKLQAWHDGLNPGPEPEPQPEPEPVPHGHWSCPTEVQEAKKTSITIDVHETWKRSARQQVEHIMGRLTRNVRDLVKIGRSDTWTEEEAGAVLSYFEDRVESVCLAFSTPIEVPKFTWEAAGE